MWKLDQSSSVLEEADRSLSSLFLVPFGLNLSTSLAKIWQIHQLTVLHALGHNPLLHLLFFLPKLSVDEYDQMAIC